MSILTTIAIVAVGLLIAMAILAASGNFSGASAIGGTLAKIATASFLKDPSSVGKVIAEFPAAITSGLTGKGLSDTGISQGIAQAANSIPTAIAAGLLPQAVDKGSPDPSIAGLLTKAVGKDDSDPLKGLLTQGLKDPTKNDDSTKLASEAKKGLETIKNSVLAVNDNVKKGFEAIPSKVANFNEDLKKGVESIPFQSKA